ncbi:hypothetical protein ATX49_09665 [Oenococcus oeni]|nr:hypothetical protein ATX49_09665 [Oenococcus oeni]
MPSGKTYIKPQAKRRVAILIFTWKKRRLPKNNRIKNRLSEIIFNSRLVVVFEELFVKLLEKILTFSSFKKYSWASLPTNILVE